MSLEYEHDDHCLIAWKFPSKLLLDADRPGFSFKSEETILELWCGMAALFQHFIKNIISKHFI